MQGQKEQGQSSDGMKLVRNVKSSHPRNHSTGTSTAKEKLRKWLPAAHWGKRPCDEDTEKAEALSVPFASLFISKGCPQASQFSIKWTSFGEKSSSHSTGETIQGTEEVKRIYASSWY